MKMEKGMPYYVKTDFEIIRLKLQKKTIYILPDKLLINQKGEYKVIDYKTLDYDIAVVDFVESGAVPRDTNILSYTWKYVNKDGSPDRRFSDNRQLPVCEYANITAMADKELLAEIMCSSASVAINFGENILLEPETA